MSARNARRRELARQRHRDKVREEAEAETFTGLPAGRSGARLHAVRDWDLERCLVRGGAEQPDVVVFVRRSPDGGTLAVGAFHRDPDTGLVRDAFSADDLGDWELEGIVEHLGAEQPVTEADPVASALLVHQGVVAGARSSSPPPPTYGAAKGVFTDLLRV